MPIRVREFVTRKTTSGLAEVKHGRREALSLGNIEARRDWATPATAGGRVAYAAPTGSRRSCPGNRRTTSVRDYCKLAAERLGFALEWMGKGDRETRIDRNSGKTIIRIEPCPYPPAEVDKVTGDAAKSGREWGWSPAMTLADLVTMMVEADDRSVRENRLLY